MIFPGSGQGFELPSVLIRDRSGILS